MWNPFKLLFRPRKSLVKTFLDTLEWYGKPMIADFLKKYETKLRKSCNRADWYPVGFMADFHRQILRNDYEYILALVSYRFGDPGVYEWCVSKYREEVRNLAEAKNLADIWFAFHPKQRHCYTEFGILVRRLSSEENKVLSKIAHDTNTPFSASVAQRIIDNCIHFNIQDVSVEECVAQENNTQLQSKADPILESILSDFVIAWQKADAELIIKHLSEGFVYDSQWVFESLDYKGYVEYIRGKMKTIKKNCSIPAVSIVPDSHSAHGKMLALKQGGNVCYYRIRIEDGKVVKGDMCMF